MTEPALSCPHCGAAVLDIDVRCAACGAGLTSTGAQRRVGEVVLEHYRVTEVLGQGGMSVVYRGVHRLTGQAVALKILPPELASYAHVKSRFVEEARALAALDHPGIVHLYAFGPDDDSFVLAMQYVEGRTWERMIVEGGRLDWQTSTRIALDVARALEYAHSRGVIHRDMKPSNVLVRGDGSATVMDFGIAKMTTSTRLTATGQTMGTVRYMSPEQVRGAEVDARTDIYSLAVSLYESLTGNTPFEGDSHFEIMTAHLSKPPPPVAERAPDAPPALARLLMASMAKAPRDRPASAAVFRAALEDILAGRTAAPAGARAEGTPPDAPPAIAAVADAPPPRSRPSARRSGRLVVALATLVAASGAATAIWMSRGGDRRAVAAAPPVAARAPAAPPVRDPVAWPAPFTLPELRFAVDQTFAAERLRVQSVAARSADDVRAAFVAAQDRFFAQLASAGVEGIARQPLNVVIVPPSVLCDRRIDERGRVAAGCADAGVFLRLAEKTALLADRVGADAGRLPIDLAQAVATNVCLHAPSGGCDAALDRFLDDSARDGEAAK